MSAEILRYVLRDYLGKNPTVIEQVIRVTSFEELKQVLSANKPKLPAWIFSDENVINNLRERVEPALNPPPLSDGERDYIAIEEEAEAYKQDFQGQWWKLSGGAWVEPTPYDFIDIVILQPHVYEQRLLVSGLSQCAFNGQCERSGRGVPLSDCTCTGAAQKDQLYTILAYTLEDALELAPSDEVRVVKE